MKGFRNYTVSPVKGFTQFTKFVDVHYERTHYRPGFNSQRFFN